MVVVDALGTAPSPDACEQCTHLFVLRCALANSVPLLLLREWIGTNLKMDDLRPLALATFLVPRGLFGMR